MRKIINVYIVYELDAWLRNPTNNFNFKNCLFGEPSIVKNRDKEKYVYSGYAITFNSTGSWGFDNDYAGNIIIFCVDSTSSSRADNRKNNFLILAEDPPFGINGKFFLPEKKLSNNFTKVNTNFVLVCIIMLILVICLKMENKSLSLKPKINV